MFKNITKIMFIFFENPSNNGKFVGDNNIFSYENIY